MPLGDYVRVTHPASFFTALPLSTAGRVFSIHERAEGRGPQAREGGGGSCRNTSWVFELITVLCMATSRDLWIQPSPSDVNLKRVKQANGFPWHPHLTVDESALIDVLFHNHCLYKYWWTVGTHLCLMLACSWPFSEGLVHWLQKEFSGKATLQNRIRFIHQAE